MYTMARATARGRKPRRRSGGKRVPVARRSKKASAAKQYATITETVSFEPINPNIPLAYCFNLSQFNRASRIATNFKWYKAAKVEWNVQAQFNTFEDGVGTDSVPQMYTVMNRTQDSLGCNLQDLQAMGAKPRKLTGKLTNSYVPNWCSPGLSTFTEDADHTVIIGGTSQGLKPQFGFLACPSTQTGTYGQLDYIAPLDGRDAPLPPNSGMNVINVNQVLYNGHYAWVDQKIVGGTATVATITATVTWIFKDPMFNGVIAVATQKPLIA